MKKNQLREVSYCDCCGKEQPYLTKCMCCGKEFCFECRNEKGREYSHAVHFGGSRDGFYCHLCDLKLTESREDKLHNAYIEIALMRSEEKTWWKNFEERMKPIEKEIEMLTNAAAA